MKKILSIFAIILIFSFSASAQEDPKSKTKKTDTTTAAKKEVKQAEGKTNGKNYNSKKKGTRMAITNKGLPAKEKSPTETKKDGK